MDRARNHAGSRSAGDLLIRLPKKLEADPEAARLSSELVTRARPLWSGAKLLVAQVELGPRLEAALGSAYSSGQIVRGLEDAERALAKEARGLDKVDQKTGVARGGRVSRLLVLADDGAERFYRRVESLANQHAPRVLVLRLSVNEETLGQLLFGPDQVARLLLVEHKDAVSAVLRALVEQWGP